MASATAAATVSAPTEPEVVPAHRAVLTADRRPYVVYDTDGRPVDPAEAKTIIAVRYTVPEDVRRRRRSKKKVGKASRRFLRART